MRWYDFLFGTRPTPDESPKAKREALEEEIKIARLSRAKKLVESYGNQDYWLTNYADILARYQDGGILSYPVSQPTDRRYGSNFPFWVSEQQLSLLRAQARMVTTMNPNAQGLLNGLCSYVIGTGYKYRAVAKETAEVNDEILKKVNAIIDKFIDENSWAEMEQELFIRSREDGECFVRLFPQSNGCLYIRTIEPEQVFQPPGQDLPHYSYGIKTDPDDVFEIQAYYVSYMAPRGENGDQSKMLGEEVKSENIVHIKCNVKRAIKRGLSDFSYETLDTFMVASKLRANLGEGAAVQAAIAGIRQHDANNLSQVDTFINNTLDYTATSPVTMKETDFQTIRSGSFLDIPKGMNYVSPPAAANSSGHLEIFQALLRSAGNRHNAPEWLVSSDSSNNNYASSLSAESPFLRSCLRLQKFYERPFVRIIKAAIKAAINAGRLPQEIDKMINVQVTCPTVETRDRAQEANTNQIYQTMGVKSLQTIAQEVGLDWNIEMANMEETKQETDLPGALPVEYSEDNSELSRPEPDSIEDEETEDLEEEQTSKYSHIDFTPPKGAREAAKRALEVRAEKPESQRGMTAVGIARARDLSNGKALSPETVRRMKAYFDRHQSDKSGESWDEQGKGWQAWMGWGGDPGYAWARKVVKQMEAADNKE